MDIILRITFVFNVSLDVNNVKMLKHVILAKMDIIMIQILNYAILVQQNVHKIVHLIMI